MLNHKEILINKRLDDVNLKQEENNKFLNEGHAMHNLSCRTCEKRLVKNSKGHSNKESITIFNGKRTALCCEELLTFGPTVCRFCIFCDCKFKMHDVSSDKNKQNYRSTRSSGRNK